MIATTGTELAKRLGIVAVVIAVAAVLPVQWRVAAKRVWSHLFYYFGYRVLALELDGSVVATIVTFGVKHAATLRI